MRLIDADALIMDLREHKISFNTSINEAIVIAPTVDAKLVIHGHWIIEDMYTYELSYGSTLYEPVYRCSCCGRVTESYARIDKPIMPEDADSPKFCGNCGAKMDEVKENENDKRR